MGDRYWLFNVWFAYRGNGSDLADNVKGDRNFLKFVEGGGGGGGFS